MKWIDRNINNQIIQMVESRPVILVTGIRQTGKSSLLQKLFPRAKYITFDNYLHVDTAVQNPSSFLSNLKDEEQVILDEVQYVPELFRELKILVDEKRTTPARWILTGSQKFVLLESARESLAGRIGLLELETLGTSEIRNIYALSEIENLLWKGGFPETWVNNAIRMDSYLDDYITTYLEKDLRNIINTPNLRDFHRFLRSCAIRSGSLVNHSEMARDTGISPNTAKSWLNTLSRSGIITLLEPWFSNLSKRLTKTPKLYFNDQGILCRLLNITSKEQLDGHPLIGSIWENFVFNELIRQEGISAERNLFFYRDQNQVEIDFIVEKNGRKILIEAKYAEKPGKMRINTVGELLKSRKEDRFCACRIPSEGFFYNQEGIKLYNPLFTTVFDSTEEL